MSTNSTASSAGVSKYSADLQAVIARTVAIASLPLTQLNNQLNALTARSAAIDALNANFSALQTSLGNLDSNATSATALGSDPAVATVHAAPTTLPGTYSLTVVNAGSQTTTLSPAGLPVVSDPSTQSLTAATSLTLSVGGTAFTITPAANSLQSLAAAINAAGAGVSATIINLGSSAAPDYRLTLRSDALDNVAIQLNDGTQDLLQTLVTGSAAQYQINGQPTTPIVSTSRTITISPGLTADLQAVGTTNITVALTSSALVTAITSFVSAYNASASGLAAQHGPNAGALGGDPVLATLTASLRSLTGYAGTSGTIGSLADLGITLDKTGALSFNQGTFDSAFAANSGDVIGFLGSASTGGFLKSAADTLTSLEDPISGILPLLHNATQDRITSQNAAISSMQDRIDLIQANVTARVSAADALIASLESQVSYYTTLFQSMFNNNGNKNN